MSNTEYSSLTCKNYSLSITSIRRIYQDEYKDSFKHPECFEDSDKIIQMLSKYYQKSTIINFISAILWELNKLNNEQYTAEYIQTLRASYQTHGATLKAQIERSKIGKEFELTEKEQKSFMIWEKIVEMYENVEDQLNIQDYNQFMDFVILSLYLLHPPARADYANMKLYIDDHLIPPNETENYCVLQSNPRFVFQKYKTAKHKGITVIPMDPRLHEILLGWADLYPSSYLLSIYCPSTKQYKPMTENTLSKRMTYIFKRHASVPVTINTLRHSYISFMSKHDQEYERKRTNADKMMHSLSMADKYRRMVYLE
jgi:integrase